jgi:hypothetical protein
MAAHEHRVNEDKLKARVQALELERSALLTTVANLKTLIPPDQQDQIPHLLTIQSLSGPNSPALQRRATVTGVPGVPTGTSFHSPSAMHTSYHGVTAAQSAGNAMTHSHSLTNSHRSNGNGTNFHGVTSSQSANFHGSSSSLPEGANFHGSTLSNSSSGQMNDSDIRNMGSISPSRAKLSLHNSVGVYSDGGITDETTDTLCGTSGTSSSSDKE